MPRLTVARFVATSLLVLGSAACSSGGDADAASSAPGGAQWPGDTHGGAGGAAGYGGGGLYADAAAMADSSWDSAGAAGSSFQGVQAGEWDDNAHYQEFLKYLASSQSLGILPVDVSERRFVVVTDASELAVANCPVTISDGSANVAQLKTLGSGRAPFFPHAAGVTGPTLTVTASCAEGSATKTFAPAGVDDVLSLVLSGPREAWATKTVDLAFVLDTTGSMAEEIDAIKQTIDAVAQLLTPSASGVQARVGLVAYRDQGDAYVTKVFPFTTDLSGFQASIASLSADGGGDIPEATSNALYAAETSLAWNDAAFARFAFLISDAAPHIPDPFQHSYATEMRVFHDRGIQLFTISASGQDALGQAAFRQIAQYTYATNMFVLVGGAGPQSTGGGNPNTSCGSQQTDYSVGALHELIVGKVKDEVALFDGNPYDIPGLGGDVTPTPCPDGGADVDASAE